MKLRTIKLAAIGAVVGGLFGLIPYAAEGQIGWVIFSAALMAVLWPMSVWTGEGLGQLAGDVMYGPARAELERIHAELEPERQRRIEWQQRQS